MINANRVNVPMCVSLGGGLVLDTTVTPPELRAAPVVVTPTPAAPAPWLAVDRIDLAAANIGATQTERDKQTTAFLATGLNYPDALAGIPAAASVNAPPGLVMTGCLPASVKAQLDRMRGAD